MTEDELILTHVLQCSRADLYLKRPQLTPQQQQQLELIKKRRALHEPLQYILGECEFMGIPLKVDRRVLTPRPETELLVEKVLKQMSDFAGQEIAALDIGSGSGNIAIALAKHNPGWRITSIDISQDAVELARENAELNKVSIDFIEADVFQWLSENTNLKQFSLIVSNPPYIQTKDLASLPDDVKQEPQQALDGGDDGLKFYQHIVSQVQHVLKPGGWIFFEIGETQGKSLENLLTQIGSFVNIETIKDFNGKDRIIQAQIKFM